MDSAAILGKAFGVPFEEHEVLWSENRHPEDLPKTLELVRSKKETVDVLILVTHLEYVNRFPTYFAKEELGSYFPHDSINKGEACDIECEAKTITHVR